MPKTPRGDAKQRIHQAKGSCRWLVYHIGKLAECDIEHTPAAIRGMTVVIQGMEIIDDLLDGIQNELAVRVNHPEVDATFRQALVMMPACTRVAGGD